MSRKPSVTSAPRHVGLYLDSRLDEDASDVAALRGTTKSAIYASGLRLVFGDLTDDERRALEAMRAARRSGP